jgi:hypothetical protein
MLTKNFYILNVLTHATQAERKPVSLVGWDGGTNMYYYWYNGVGQPVYVWSSMATVATSAPHDASDFTKVVFGTGDTPPTINDYNLSGDVITTLSAICETTCSINSDAVSMSALYTLTNNGTEEVTIKEVGLGQGFYYSSGLRNSCLVDRTVLDNPVTIPAGGIGQVKYTITFNLPTA